MAVDRETKFDPDKFVKNIEDAQPNNDAPSSGGGSSSKPKITKSYVDKSGVVRYEGTTGYKEADYQRASASGQRTSAGKATLSTPSRTIMTKQRVESANKRAGLPLNTQLTSEQVLEIESQPRRRVPLVVKKGQEEKYLKQQQQVKRQKERTKQQVQQIARGRSPLQPPRPQLPQKNKSFVTKWAERLIKKEKDIAKSERKFKSRLGLTGGDTGGLDIREGEGPIKSTFKALGNVGYSLTVGVVTGTTGQSLLLTGEKALLYATAGVKSIYDKETRRGFMAMSKEAGARAVNVVTPIDTKVLYEGGKIKYDPSGAATILTASAFAGVRTAGQIAKSRATGTPTPGRTFIDTTKSLLKDKRAGKRGSRPGRGIASKGGRTIRRNIEVTETNRVFGGDIKSHKGNTGTYRPRARTYQAKIISETKSQKITTIQKVQRGVTGKRITSQIEQRTSSGKLQRTPEITQRVQKGPSTTMAEKKLYPKNYKTQSSSHPKLRNKGKVNANELGRRVLDKGEKQPLSQRTQDILKLRAKQKPISRSELEVPDYVMQKPLNNMPNRIRINIEAQRFKDIMKPKGPIYRRSGAQITKGQTKGEYLTRETVGKVTKPYQRMKYTQQTTKPKEPKLMIDKIRKETLYERPYTKDKPITKRELIRRETLQRLKDKRAKELAGIEKQKVKPIQPVKTKVEPKIKESVTDTVKPNVITTQEVIQKTNIAQVPSALTMPTLAQGLGVKPQVVTEPKIDLTFKALTTQPQENKVDVTSNFKPKQEEEEKQDISPLQIQTPKIIPGRTHKVPPRKKEDTPKPPTDNIIEPIDPIPPPTRKEIIKRKIEENIPGIPRIPKSPKIKRQSKEEIRETGYNVFTRRGGIPIKININPLSRQDAENFAQFVVGTTARASYKVEEAGAPVSDTFSGRGRPETFKQGRFGWTIEKKKYRISSPGEKKEITLKGILATKKKGKKFL